jgi:hypothetical protein
VVGHTETWLVSDHPVCGAKVGFAEIFLMPQPPLLEEGNVLARTADQFVHKMGPSPICKFGLRI